MSKLTATVFVILLLSTAAQPVAGILFLIPAAAAGAVGGVLTAAGVPSLLGFGSAGIAAGSTAAGMMSASALASGGGVVAGGLVATMQSIGAAGLTAGMAATAATAGACVGAGAGSLF